jgi:Holliday junction resolvase RusA-like endonuclease
VTIIIELVGEPRGKGRPRFVRKTGVAFTPAATRNYEASLRLAAQDVMAGRAPMEGAISVVIDAYFPVPTSGPRRKREAALTGAVRPQVKPDLDNIIKNFDALNEIVCRDDKQIVDATVRKSYSDRPRLRIEITETAQ